MPQNTQMKRQFTTIDGRTVMSNLPQHWGGNDWKVTGVDNPLPVGNYVQTESGVWIPQKGSDDGAADVRLTGSTVEELIMDGVEIAPGSTSETFDLNNKGESNFRGFYFAVRSDTSNYSVDIIWNVHARGYFARFRDVETFTATRERYISDFIKLKTIRPQIRIVNNSDSPSVFDCHVLWVK